MKKNFVDELRWRGMLQDMMPGTEDQLNKEMTAGYIGFDPTADSLGVGNLVQIMTLLHFQRAGHKPFALVGGATGMIGDPSGKSSERNLLSEEILRHNQACQQKQLEKFIDFNCGDNSAEIVNNYDWFKEFTFLDFIRDVGKKITVNYMMSKDSVKNRLDGSSGGEGMSFTEFTYQLIQGYDFYWLNKNRNCKIQMGGSDQWGNITTGTELIRRMGGGEAFALTTPLIKKADGTKFGKSESGNVWLDAKKTSPYKFYQFWINASDEDAETYIKIFSLKGREELEALIAEHKNAPHQRLLQKELAKEITIRVHSGEDYNTAIEASEILFGKGTTETLSKLPEDVLLSVFEGLPIYPVSRTEIEAGVNVVELLAEKAKVFPSKGEAKRSIQGGGVSLNKNKVPGVDAVVNAENLLNRKYILAQKGKKDYYLIIAQ
jgi:tyrosyl-tRNA synthetase